MIVFDKLEISEDYNNISIDVAISSEPEYAKHYISKIYVEYYRNRNSDCVPSDKSAVAYENSDTSVRKYSGDFSIEQMHSADSSIQSFEGGLFYIIIACKSPDVEDEILCEVGAVLDMQKVYKVGMAAVSGFASSCDNNRCDIPAELEQFILVYHSLRLSLQASDIDKIDSLWRRFISYDAPGASHGCGCSCGK